MAMTDIGAIAALPFEDPERSRGRTVELAADERTMAEIAEAYGHALGRPVRYEQTPLEEAMENGEDDASMMRFFEEGGFDVDIDPVRRLRPELLSFDDYPVEAGWSSK
jgi:uncharacterized protein YbjT (DUF2867 family)